MKKIGNRGAGVIWLQRPFAGSSACMASFLETVSERYSDNHALTRTTKYEI
jgi:hypothetical protein